ncbi:hypothetical protein IT084_16550 [Desulfallas sp. Bu1-1]|uniref:hypothetical protein n=1 Tax=Desulfallas sp. Bu1-1 TaxID=2787620 RepID=UPI00189E2E6D|nr:hypothetical protein [Desulfallas sp. Bu1-1]MBF7084552.1 hypothetical protein [Desulfallas sp. Bu1-1]
MVRKSLILVLIFLCATIFGDGTCFAAKAKSGQEYVFLIFVKELEQPHLEERGLPNIGQLKDGGIYYRSVARPDSPPEDCLLSILGQKNTMLFLPLALANNGVNCTMVDGSGRLPQNLLKKNNVDVISEQNDRLVLDKFFEVFDPDRPQFVTIYLDDPSNPANDKYLPSSQRWSNADNQVGRLLNYLINSKALNNTSIILTSGAPKPPLILFRHGYPNAEYYYCHQSDIAPTICKIFGVSPPAGLSGNILFEFLSRSPDTNLQKRINDLQEQCLLANRKINLLQEEQRLVNIQKYEIVQERKNFRRIISEKDQIIKQLNVKIKIFKFLSILAVFIFLAGYIVEYKILRKKFLIFP